MTLTKLLTSTMVGSGHSLSPWGFVFGLVGDGKAVEHGLCTGKAEQSQYDFNGRNIMEFGLSESGAPGRACGLHSHRKPLRRLRAITLGLAPRWKRGVNERSVSFRTFWMRVNRISLETPLENERKIFPSRQEGKR